MVIYLLGGLHPLIMLLIWTNLNDSGALDSNYSSSHFVCYFLLIFTVRNLSPMWFPWALDDEIRQGDLSFKLLRPVNPYWNYLAYQLSDSAIRAPMMIPFVAIGFLWTGAYQEISVGHLPLALVALTSSMAIHFFANFLMGIAAFWMERAKAFDVMYYTLMILLGGAIVPIEFFPDTIASIIKFTPFPYILGFPVDVIMGSISKGEIITGILAQWLWIAAIGLSGNILWRLGTKRYAGAGS